ncbi:class I SAM-dependent methyltransferase [Phycicoccus jejuensis]|uniref:class I SAM-dependent methyltransferase n=1 Tax=Phycicoccus jejuensis TaxID=367299 RepID=UPI00384B88EF
MSHPEQLAFIAACVEANRDLVDGGSVLEVGSYDVNGSVRSVFAAARRYVGVDLVEGPGVDIVAAGKDVEAPDASFDVTVSGECFEHDPDWRETLRAMVRLTRPGGLVIVTCASRGRVEHGTRRTTATESPGTQSLGLDYYRNVSIDDVKSLPLVEWFDQHLLVHAPRAADLYLCGVRRGRGEAPSGTLPDEASVSAAADLMSPVDRAVRLPLRAMAFGIRDEARFQAVATRYWRLLLLVGAAARRLRRPRGSSA